MKHAIEVFPGKSARLDRLPSAFNVPGLITDYYTSNILVIITDLTVELVHIDDSHSIEIYTSLLESIPALKDPGSHVSLISRHTTGERLRKTLREALSQYCPKKDVKYQLTPDNVDNYVYVSLENHCFSTTHPLIDIRECENTRDISILSHPQRRQSLSVYKIEELVGIRDRKKNNKKYNRRLCDYDNAWLPIPANELHVDCKEMQLFSTEDTFFSLVHKLTELTEDIDQTNTHPDDIERFIQDVAFYLETYLNPDLESLFIKNIIDLLSTNVPQLQEEISFKNKIVNNNKN